MPTQDGEQLTTICREVLTTAPSSRHLRSTRPCSHISSLRLSLSLYVITPEVDRRRS